MTETVTKIDSNKEQNQNRVAVNHGSIQPKVAEIADGQQIAVKTSVRVNADGILVIQSA